MNIAKLLPPRRHDAKLARCYHSLRTYLDAGFPIRQAVRETNFSGLIAEEGKSSLENRLGEGEAFSDLLDEKSFLPAVDRACLRAGERSGHLSQVLARLERVREREASMRREIVTKSLYPALLLHVAALVLPLAQWMQSGFFAYATQVATTLLGFYALGILLVALWVWLPRSPLAPSFYVLPVVGRFRRDLEIATFARAFEELFQAGVGLVEGFRLASRSVDSPWIREQLLRGIPVLDARDSLLAAFQTTGVFRSMELQILEVGEKSGRLDEAFSRLGKILQEEGEEGRKRFVFWLTQAVHIGIMIWVASGILGFYRDYYSTINSLR